MLDWINPPRAPKEHPNRLIELQNCALEIASGDIGKGEAGRNNAGPYLEFIRSQDGTGWCVTCRHHWCATFVNSCYYRAAGVLGYRLPFQGHRKAKTVFKRMCVAGVESSSPREGGVVVWHRGRQDLNRKWYQRAGHIELVSFWDGEDMFTTIAGNVGAYPALVHRREYSLKREQRKGKLVGFASLA